VSVRKVLSVHILLGLTLAALPDAFASSTFNINPTFGASITSDTNFAAIEATINSVIAIYNSTFVVPGPNPVTANITFDEMAGGLGQSNSFFGTISYASYCAALQTFGTVGSGSLNCGVDPLNGGAAGAGNINVKTVDLRALNLGGAAASDGTISLNTSITNPGSPGSTNAFPLAAVVAHEIDEVLGLGSGLDNVSSAGATPITSTFGPFAQDLFRYSGVGTLIFNLEVGALCNSSLGSAYFSTDGGSNNLAGFNNTCNGGDWADWDAAISRIQNAFADGSNPSLGVEITALEAMGFESAVPEPGTMALLGTGLVGFGIAAYRRRKT
jgi:hypothetical protein